MPEATAIGTLAEFVVSARRSDIPDTVYERSKDCVLDVIGAASAGNSTLSPHAVYRAMKSIMGSGNASIWFQGTRGAPPSVAMVNAMAATALDIDDGHRLAAGHPGSAVVCAAAAAAEDCDASFEDFLVSVILGYEVSIAVALARREEFHQSTVSGRWSGVGAAAAAAKLYGAKPGAMRHAMLVAEQHAPRLASAQFHGFAGADVKEGIAWSVLTGIVAANLGGEGFGGYPNTFENLLYSAKKLTANLGKYQAISGLFFKPYACCRWIHAALDGVLGIMRDEGIEARAIQEIVVLTFRNAARLGNHVAPTSALEAQFSIPFCLAILAECGPNALCPMPASVLSNRRVLALAQRVKIIEDREMEEMFPAHAPAIVRIKSRRSAFERRIETSWGDPANPMNRQHIQEKFRKLMSHGLASSLAAPLSSAVFTGDGSDAARKLFDIAATRVSRTRQLET